MNEQIKPMYQLFQISNQDFFMFDTYANKIKRISKNCFEYLYKFSKETTNFFEKAESVDDIEFKEFYKESLKQGLFKKFSIEKLQHPMTEPLEDVLDANIESINLQVTQNCNLRCDYCPYTGNYYNNRKHSNKRMSFELAKKGIDFLYNHSMNCDVVNVAFYGGEPLLEFELIKRCVKYAREKFISKKVVFNLTTNGVLLTDEIMKFFSDNEILLTISLDGPKNIHDKSRVTANGTGSFELIYEKLCYFKEKYLEYFNQNVSFNSVSAQDDGVIDIDLFFTEDPLFEFSKVNTTFYSTNYLSDEKAFDKQADKFRQHMEFEKYKCFLHKMKRVKALPTRIQLNSFNEVIRTAKQLQDFTGIPKVFHPSGPCVPGRKKLFMNIDGNFYPCERIDETSPCSVIGNIEEGLSLDQCKMLLNVGKITEEKCKSCWAIAHCKLCFVQADNGGELCAKNRLDHCGNLQDTIIDTFKNICVLAKSGYHFEEDV
ncbi:MAG: radical SAM protein [Clostridiales bacterium]|nr:radical SAM protein [Clostridiales bacterium]